MTIAKGQCAFSLSVLPHLRNTMPPPDPQQLTKEVANACEHFCRLFSVVFFSWLSSFFHHRQHTYLYTDNRWSYIHMYKHIFVFVRLPPGHLYSVSVWFEWEVRVFVCICVARFGSIFQELLILNNSRGSLNSS